jgi:hypothetical protein
VEPLCCGLSVLVFDFAHTIISSFYFCLVGLFFSIAVVASCLSARDHRFRLNLKIVSSIFVDNAFAIPLLLLLKYELVLHHVVDAITYLLTFYVYYMYSIYSLF